MGRQLKRILEMCSASRVVISGVHHICMNSLCKVRLLSQHRDGCGVQRDPETHINGSGYGEILLGGSP